MSADSGNVVSSPSESNMEKDYPQRLKTGFKGEGEDILPNLPSVVKKRVKALKKLLANQTEVDSQFFRELHVLECKYNKKYVEFYNRRSDIVQGFYEPTEEECDFPSDEEDYANELSTDIEEKLKLEESKPAVPKEENTNDAIKGIPEFWLSVLKNASLVNSIIQPHDEPILSHLTDIKVYLLEEPMGFGLEFHFSPNEWFSNSILTKEYEIKCVPDKNNPFDFEGPEISKCKGCTIQWKEGKNVTVKLIKKKQKKKVQGTVRFVNKTIKVVSFFHFFNPPSMTDDPETDDEEDFINNNDFWLAKDFEIGHYIRERIMPRAVLYYTGEAKMEESDFDDNDEDEETDYDNDDDDEVEGY